MQTVQLFGQRGGLRDCLHASRDRSRTVHDLGAQQAYGVYTNPDKRAACHLCNLVGHIRGECSDIYVVFCTQCEWNSKMRLSGNGGWSKNLRGVLRLRLSLTASNINGSIHFYVPLHHPPTKTGILWTREVIDESETSR